MKKSFVVLAILLSSLGLSKGQDSIYAEGIIEASVTNGNTLSFVEFYFGTNIGTYYETNRSMVVSNKTRVTFSHFVPGITNYVAAKTFGTNGLVSTFSSILMLTNVPFPPKLTIVSKTTNDFGYIFELQESPEFFGPYKTVYANKIPLPIRDTSTQSSSILRALVRQTKGTVQ